jgi:hypothetical protein
MLISVDRTGKNLLEQGHENMEDVPVLSHCSLLRNPKKTDWFFGEFLCRRNQIMVLHYAERFFLNA